MSVLIKSVRWELGHCTYQNACCLSHGERIHLYRRRSTFLFISNNLMFIKPYWEHYNAESTFADLELETHYKGVLNTAVDFEEEI